MKIFFFLKRILFMTQPTNWEQLKINYFKEIFLLSLFISLSLSLSLSLSHTHSLSLYLSLVYTVYHLFQTSLSIYLSIYQCVCSRNLWHKNDLTAGFFRMIFLKVEIVSDFHKFLLLCENIFPNPLLSLYLINACKEIKYFLMFIVI